MTTVLGLDISSKTGWAVFEDKKLQRYGTIYLDKKVHDFGELPYNYVDFAKEYVKEIITLIAEVKPDEIIIEQTVKSRARFSQKLLEYLHCVLLLELRDTKFKVYYLSPSIWRKSLGLAMTKEDKKNNAKINKAKKQNKSKKELGLKGKITRKHLSVRYACAFFGLDLKMKDNDAAEAVLLAYAHISGAREPTQ